MLVIDEATSRDLLEMKEAIPRVAESFRMISAGSILGLRGNVSDPEHSARGLLLSSYVGMEEAACFKVIGNWHGKTAGLIVVFDTALGRAEAVVDGKYVTDFRTGAVSGVATECLARGDSTVLAILGTGKQSVTQLQAVLAVRPIEAVLVWNRTRANAVSWIERMRALLGPSTPRFTMCDTPEVACREADVVVLATSASEPVLRGEWLRPGTHVNAVGAGSPTHRELDRSVLARADVMVLDSRELALKSGDFAELLEQGVIRPHDFAELGDLLTGAKRGRTESQQITLFKSVGHAANDLAVARLLARKARESGRGVEVDI